MTLDESTRHTLPGGLEYGAPDQDDWSLGSDNPGDFGSLSTKYTTCQNQSSIRPHISTNETAHVPPTQQHTDTQRAYWFQQAHDTSCAKFIPLTRPFRTIQEYSNCVFTSAWSEQLLACTNIHIAYAPQRDPNNHPLRQTAVTNHPARSSIPPPNPANTWRDSPDANHVHRKAHRHVITHRRVRARRSCSVDSSAPAPISTDLCLTLIMPT